jgi:hypothetical protein
LCLCRCCSPEWRIGHVVLEAALVERHKVPIIVRVKDTGEDRRRGTAAVVTAVARHI